jgi:hypothetical protein
VTSMATLSWAYSLSGIVSKHKEMDRAPSH